MLDKKKNVGVERTYLRNANVRWFDFDLSNLLQMRITDDEIDKEFNEVYESEFMEGEDE